MRTRTLRLRRERFAELDRGAMRAVVGGVTILDLCESGVTRITREPRCHWTDTWDPDVCLTLGPCHR